MPLEVTETPWSQCAAYFFVINALDAVCEIVEMWNVEDFFQARFPPRYGTSRALRSRRLARAPPAGPSREVPAGHVRQWDQIASIARAPGVVVSAAVARCCPGLRALASCRLSLNTRSRPSACSLDQPAPGIASAEIQSAANARECA
jgi:hypothetical protein